MGHIQYTPAVQDVLSTVVVSRFGDGVAAARVSGIMQICAPGMPQGGANYVALILGKNGQMQRRDKDSDEVDITGVNIYESRAEVANYQRWIRLSRHDAKFDRVDKLRAVSHAAGMSAAEQPTRMVEAVVPLSLELVCHTKVPFYSKLHKVNPDSSETWANMDDLGPLDFDSYDEGVRQFAQMPDEDGRACGSKPSILACGTAHKERGREILANQRPKDYQGGDNPRTADNVQLVVVDDWPETFWGLFDCASTEDRSHHYVEAEPFRVIPVETDPDGPFAIKYNRIEWAVDGYAALLLGNPRKSFLSVKDANVAAIVAAAKAKMQLNEFDFRLA
jgi:hypothetical protein